MKRSPDANRAPLALLGTILVGVVGVVGALLGTVLLLAGPFAASAAAHAVLQGSDPAPDAVLAAAPARVTLTFDESVSLVPGSVRVYAPDGRRADDGDVTHPGGHGERVSVGLQAGDTDRGTYLVSWRVVSDDSHPVSGAFTFSVGRAGAAPGASPDAGSFTVRAGLAVARWLGYVGSALLVGGALVLAWCWPEGWGRRPVRRLLLGGAALLAVGAVADLLLKGPYDAALGPRALTEGTLLREVLGSTYGHATLARLVLVAITPVAVVALRARGGVGPPSRLLVSLLAVAFGLSFAYAGHAAAGNGRTLALVNDTVHVLSASAWLGGLVLVLVAVESAAVVRRFSRVAVVAVLVLIATGISQAARQVGSWAALWHTAYGRELLTKLAVLAVVLALAAVARLVAGGTAHPPGGATPARLRALVLAETVGLCVVLGITSALVATEPARTAYRPSVTGSLRLLGETVQVSAVPVGDRRLDLHVYLTDAAGRPAAPKRVSASVALPQRQLGPLPVALTADGPGHRSATLAVPVAGEWRLAITVRTTAVDEATGYVTLPIR